MGKILAVLYGGLSYVVFFGAFLYAIAFADDVVVPKTIDSDPAGLQNLVDPDCSEGRRALNLCALVFARLGAHLLAMACITQARSLGHPRTVCEFSVGCERLWLA